MDDNHVFIDYLSGESFSDKINKLEKDIKESNIEKKNMVDIMKEINNHIKTINCKLDNMTNELNNTTNELNNFKEQIKKMSFDNSVEVERIVNSSIRSNNPIKFHSSYLDKYKR